MIKYSMESTRVSLSEKLKTTNHPATVAEAYLIADKTAAKLSPCLDGAETRVLYEALDCYFGGFVQFLEAYVDLEAATVKSELESSVDEVVFKSVEVDAGEFGDPDRDCVQVFEAFSERLLSVADSAYTPVNLSIKRSLMD